MPKFISKTELENSAKPQEAKKVHNVGEIYPEIFSHSKDLTFSEDMPLDCAVMWLGAFQTENSHFKREKCPICGKEEVLIPYMCGGSILSGGHTIWFYCTNCNEQFITNDHIEYFRSIYKYALANRDNLKPTPKFSSCTSLPKNAEVISHK